MISGRKLCANRANAVRSTGPRSQAGRLRASKNAHKHGLSVPVLANPGLAAAVKALAEKIAGDHANAELREMPFMLPKRKSI
jgi:hypothetical protein